MFSSWGSSITSSTDCHTQSQKYHENMNNCRQEDNLTPDNWYDIVLSDEEEIPKNDNSCSLINPDDATQQGIVNISEHEIKVSTSVCDTDHVQNIHSISKTLPVRVCKTTTDLLKSVALQNVIGCEAYKMSTLQPSCRKLSIDEVIALIDQQEQHKLKSTKSRKVSKGLSKISTTPHSTAEKKTPASTAYYTDKGVGTSSTQSPVGWTREKSPVLDLVSCATLKAKISGTDALPSKEYSKRHIERSFEALNDNSVDVTLSPVNQLNVLNAQHARMNATLLETYTAQNHLQSQLLDLLNTNSHYKHPNTCDTHVDYKWIPPVSVKYPQGEMKFYPSNLSAKDMSKENNSRGNAQALTHQPSTTHVCAGFMLNGLYPSLYCPPEAFHFPHTQTKTNALSYVNESAQDSSLLQLEDEALEEILKRIPQDPSQGTKQRRKVYKAMHIAPSLSFSKRSVHCTANASESLSHCNFPALKERSKNISYLPLSLTVRPDCNLSFKKSEGPGSPLSNIAAQVAAAKINTKFPTSASYAQDFTAQDLSAQDLSAQDLSAQDLSAQDLCAQDLFPQDVMPKSLSILNQEPSCDQFKPFVFKSLKYFARKPTSQ